MEKLSELLFEALTFGGSLSALRTAMTEYETTHHVSLRSALRQPAFRKLWSAMAEACAYESQQLEASNYEEAVWTASHERDVINARASYENRY